MRELDWEDEDTKVQPVDMFLLEACKLRTRSNPHMPTPKEAPCPKSS